MIIWQFASNNPWLIFWSVFWLSLMALAGLNIILRYCINRPLRAMNIRKHGWPPAHCDADGDFRETKEEE